MLSQDWQINKEGESKESQPSSFPSLPFSFLFLRRDRDLLFPLGDDQEPLEREKKNQKIIELEIESTASYKMQGPNTQLRVRGSYSKQSKASKRHLNLQFSVRTKENWIDTIQYKVKWKPDTSGR